MSKPRKVIRSQYMYKKKGHKIRNSLLFLLLVLLLVALGYVLSREWSKRFGDGAASSLPPSSAPVSSLPPVSSAPQSSAPPVVQAALRGRLMPEAEMHKQGDALAAVLDGYKAAGDTAVYLNLKNDNGIVTYDTKNTMALQYGAAAPQPAELSALLKAVRDAGLTPVARISALKDPHSAHVNWKNSYGYKNDPAVNWIDNSADKDGKPWLNPYMENTRSYIAGLCGELAGYDFEWIVLENVNFPTSPYTKEMGLLNETKTRDQILDQLLAECQTAAGDIPVMTAVDPVTTTLHDKEGRSFQSIMSARAYPKRVPLLNAESFRKNSAALRQKLGVTDETLSGDALVYAEMDAALKNGAFDEGAGEPAEMALLRAQDTAFLEKHYDLDKQFLTTILY